MIRGCDATLFAVTRRLLSEGTTRKDAVPRHTLEPEGRVQALCNSLWRSLPSELSSQFPEELAQAFPAVASVSALL